MNIKGQRKEPYVRDWRNRVKRLRAALAAERTETQNLRTQNAVLIAALRLMEARARSTGPKPDQQED